MVALAVTLRTATSRLVFADYLDEHYPETPVVGTRVPPGFRAWWCRSGNNAKWQPRDSRRGVDGYQIIETLRAMVYAPYSIPYHQDYGYGWLDHYGWTVIGGAPVFVSEPYMPEREALDVADLLQFKLNCPVSYSRRAHHYRGGMCVRIAVWHTLELREDR